MARHLDASERPLRSGGEIAYGAIVGHIGGHGDRRAAVGPDLGRERVQRLGACAAQTTLAPRAAKASAVARPMPLDVPAMTTA
ncbi:MAG: hypothetical protein SYR96_00625 [Actinomycetota bacterium]|nr:hypothetical protein [Actinomycetota bacterium]